MCDQPNEADKALEQFEEETGFFGYYGVSNPSRLLLELVQNSVPCYVQEVTYQKEVHYLFSKNPLTPDQTLKWLSLMNAAADSHE
jgi:hypothetical protein